MKVCPHCQTEHESEGSCLICDSVVHEEFPDEPVTPSVTALRCSPFGFGCIVAFRILLQLTTILYLVYGFSDLLKGNLFQLPLIPAVLFLSVTLCALPGLAIHHAGERDLSTHGEDS